MTVARVRPPRVFQRAQPQQHFLHHHYRAAAPELRNNGLLTRCAARLPLPASVSYMSRHMPFPLHSTASSIMRSSAEYRTPTVHHYYFATITANILPAAPSLLRHYHSQHTFSGTITALPLPPPAHLQRHHHYFATITASTPPAAPSLLRRYHGCHTGDTPAHTCRNLHACLNLPALHSAVAPCVQHYQALRPPAFGTSFASALQPRRTSPCAQLT